MHCWASCGLWFAWLWQAIHTHIHIYRHVYLHTHCYRTDCWCQSCSAFVERWLSGHAASLDISTSPPPQPYEHLACQCHAHLGKIQFRWVFNAIVDHSFVASACPYVAWAIATLAFECHCWDCCCCKESEVQRCMVKSTEGNQADPMISPTNLNTKQHSDVLLGILIPN